MALQSSGAISLGNIQTEFGGSNPIGLNEYQSTVGQSSGNAISISDFYGLSSSIHGTAISAAYVDGQYFDQSGYRESFIGSITDDTIDSFQSSTVCKITQVENLAGTLNFTISITSGSKTFNNSGFTTLNLYLGQTTNSGSPDVALARTSATFSNGTNFGRWAWDVATLGGNSSPTFVNGIFGTSTTNNFVEMV
ncbi:hypothetical protein PQZ07_00730 [bacterium]|nr:hypothetical protein [bacterium]